MQTNYRTKIHFWDEYLTGIVIIRFGWYSMVVINFPLSIQDAQYGPITNTKIAAMEINYTAVPGNKVTCCNEGQG